MDYGFLVEEAKKAMMMAYAPYSDYYVGAALLCKNGKVYTGCNIENSAYSPTNCAERTAVFKAVSDGERDFSAIAVCGGYRGNIEGIFAPCGVCRQVMLEFADPKAFKVVLADKEGYEVKTLSELIPFGFDNLIKQ